MNRGFIDCLEKEHDRILSHKSKIVIKNVHKCMCCDPHNCQPHDFIIVKNKNIKQGISIKDCIDEMVRNNVQRFCNHIFLEGFDQINDITYEAFFGS